MQPDCDQRGSGSHGLGIFSNRGKADRSRHRFVSPQWVLKGSPTFSKRPRLHTQLFISLPAWAWLVSVLAQCLVQSRGGPPAPQTQVANSPKQVFIQRTWRSERLTRFGEPKEQERVESGILSMLALSRGDYEVGRSRSVAGSRFVRVHPGPIGTGGLLGSPWAPRDGCEVPCQKV